MPGRIVGAGVCHGAFVQVQSWSSGHPWKCLETVCKILCICVVWSLSFFFFLRKAVQFYWFSKHWCPPKVKNAVTEDHINWPHHLLLVSAFPPPFLLSTPFCSVIRNWTQGLCDDGMRWKTVNPSPHHRLRPAWLPPSSDVWPEVTGLWTISE